MELKARGGCPNQTNLLIGHKAIVGQDSESRRVLTRTVGEYLSGVDPVFSITD